MRLVQYYPETTTTKPSDQGLGDTLKARHPTNHAVRLLSSSKAWEMAFPLPYIAAPLRYIAAPLQHIQQPRSSTYIVALLQHIYSSAAPAHIVALLQHI